MVLAVATSVLGTCVPGDRGKVLIVSSECSRPAWIRVSEDAQATAPSFRDQRPRQLDVGATIRLSVFDNDLDGLLLTIAGSEADVGKTMLVPHVHGREVVAVVNGESCP